MPCTAGGSAPWTPGFAVVAGSVATTAARPDYSMATSYPLRRDATPRRLSVCPESVGEELPQLISNGSRRCPGPLLCSTGDEECALLDACERDGIARSREQDDVVA